MILKNSNTVRTTKYITFVDMSVFKQGTETRDVPLCSGTHGQTVIWSKNGTHVWLNGYNTDRFLFGTGLLDTRQSLNHSKPCSIKSTPFSSKPDVCNSLSTHCITIASVSHNETKLITGALDGSIILWDISNVPTLTESSVYPIKSFIPNIRFGISRVMSIAWSPCDSMIVSGHYDGRVHLWDVASGKHLQCLGGKHEDWVWGVEWSPNGHEILSVSRDGNVILWEDTDCVGVYWLKFTLVGELSVDNIESRGEMMITCASWSPDGTKLVTGGRDDSLRIWDSETGRLISTLYGHKGGIYSVSYSPDGTRIASGSGWNVEEKGGVILVWDVSDYTSCSEKRPLILSGHTNRVTCMSWSPCGHYITSNSLDGSVRLWEDVGYIDIVKKTCRTILNTNPNMHEDLVNSIVSYVSHV